MCRNIEKRFAVMNGNDNISADPTSEERTTMRGRPSDLSGGLAKDADLFLVSPPPPPFDWVREGASFWMFQKNGEFGMLRIGVEAEPYS
jgi:hypothetical protein